MMVNQWIRVGTRIKTRSFHCLLWSRPNKNSALINLNKKKIWKIKKLNFYNILWVAQLLTQLTVQIISSPLNVVVLRYSIIGTYASSGSSMFLAGNEFTVHMWRDDSVIIRCAINYIWLYKWYYRNELQLRNLIILYMKWPIKWLSLRTCNKVYEGYYSNYHPQFLMAWI